MQTSDGKAVYLDSSALVKLIAAERESEVLATYLVAHPVQVSCALTIVEVIRAARHRGPVVVQRAQQLLHQITLIGLDEGLLHAAADVDPVSLRSLDAVHVAAAETLGNDLQAIVTYDTRMIDAARALGLMVVSPQP